MGLVILKPDHGNPDGPDEWCVYEFFISPTSKYPLFFCDIKCFYTFALKQLLILSSEFFEPELETII